MRVGLVAKGLLLKGDLDLELVLLCKDKPTADLLEKVADNLGVQLAVSATRRWRGAKRVRNGEKGAGGVCFGATFLSRRSDLRRRWWFWNRRVK